MSCLDKYKRRVASEMVYDAKSAVFTVNQLKEIVQISSNLDEVLLDAIESIKPVDYAKDIHCIKHEVSSMSEKTAKALLSQATELQKVETEVDILRKRVKVLECREMKDDRIDSLLSLIASVSTRSELEKLECEVKKLEKRMIEESCIDALTKRLICLENKKHEDSRVEHLLCELSKLEKKLAEEEVTNAKQAKAIELLQIQNIRQSEDIKALGAKLDRNSVVLDTKIDKIEREEYADKKVDASQTAQILSLQNQVAKLMCEIDRLEKTFLVRPV